MIASSQGEFWGKTLLERVNIWSIISYFWYSLQCRFGTKIKVVHLCWDKQLMHASISDCISSLLSQFRTIHLWQVHICQKVISMQWVFALPTFQLYICLWWIWYIHNFRQINSLKSVFSILPCLLKLIICILHITQVSKFLVYLTIKFGEYYHQWNCECANWTKQWIMDLVTHHFLSLFQRTVVLRLGQDDSHPWVCNTYEKTVSQLYM